MGESILVKLNKELESEMIDAGYDPHEQADRNTFLKIKSANALPVAGTASSDGEFHGTTTGGAGEKLKPQPNREPYSVGG